MRVDVKPRLILWACERAGRSVDSLAQQQSFRKSPAWVRGEASPTLRQLEHFSKATHTPFGYFFLPQPPKESVPIPDLRTIGNEHIGRPAPTGMVPRVCAVYGGQPVAVRRFRHVAERHYCGCPEDQEGRLLSFFYCLSEVFEVSFKASVTDGLVNP